MDLPELIFVFLLEIWYNCQIIKSLIFNFMKKKIYHGFLGILIMATFMVSFLNTSIVHGAPLTATNVEPQSLMKNGGSTVDVNFTTANTIPADGKIKVTFPAGFDLTNIQFGICDTMDGNGGSVLSHSGQTAIITRSGGTPQTAGAEHCTISNVRNPASAGSTGTYTIQTTTSTDVEIDVDASVPADTIINPYVELLDADDGVTPRTLTGYSNNFTKWHFGIGDILAGEKLDFTFPAGFDVSAVDPNGIFCSNLDTTFTGSSSGQTMTIVFDGGTGFASTECVIFGSINPPVSGLTVSYTVTHKYSSNVVLETITIGSSTITTNALGSTNIEPASLLAGATGTVTVTFTTTVDVGATDKIRFDFPTNISPGFNVSSASGGTCSTMDGSFATAVSGQRVTLTRSGGSIQTPAVETCTISNIKNPPVGSTGTYTIQTTTGLNNVVTHQDDAVAADTISVNALTSTNVEPASLSSGETGTATVTFTSAIAILSTDKIKVTFPAGYDVSGANGGACSTTDGSITTSVSGQTVILARSGGTTTAAGAQSCTIAGIKNPTETGATGTYTIRITTTGDVLWSEETTVSSDTISAPISPPTPPTPPAPTPTPTSAPGGSDNPDQHIVPETRPGREVVPQVRPSAETAPLNPITNNDRPIVICENRANITNGTVADSITVKNTPIKASFFLQKNTEVLKANGSPYIGPICEPVKVNSPDLPVSLPKNLVYLNAVSIRATEPVSLSKTSKVIISLPANSHFKNVKAYAYSPEKESYYLIDDGGIVVENNLSLVLDTNHFSIFVAAEDITLPVTTPEERPDTSSTNPENRNLQPLRPAPDKNRNNEPQPPVGGSDLPTTAPLTPGNNDTRNDRNLSPLTGNDRPLIVENNNTSPNQRNQIAGEGIGGSDLDNDGDGLSNQLEKQYGTDPQQKDTDKDGVKDTDEIIIDKTDPKNPKDFIDIKNIKVRVTSFEKGQEIDDSHPFVRGVAPAGSSIEIFAINREKNEKVICETITAANHVFICLIPNELNNGEYDIGARIIKFAKQESLFGMTTDQLNASTLTELKIKDSTSPLVHVKINNKLFISAPKPEKLADKILSNDNFLKDLQVVIKDNKPVLYGKTGINHEVIATWKSVVLTSAMIADSNLGEFSVNPTENLEPGTHEVYVQSLRPQDHAISKTVKISFNIDPNQSASGKGAATDKTHGAANTPLELPWSWVIGAFIVMVITGFCLDRLNKRAQSHKL